MLCNLSAIDLFAGGGGLTVGLKDAGYRVLAAVEIDPNAFSTYTANHSDVLALKQDITSVTGESLTKQLRKKSLRLDLLAGCPPCQGFSSLTSKYKREDARNDLIFEMSRLAKELRPKALMLENVPGLSQKGRVKFDRFLSEIRDLGYMPTFDVLQVADFGVPQYRRRLVMLAGHGFEIPMPIPTHSQRPLKGKQKPWITVKMALKGLRKPIGMSAARNAEGIRKANWHVVRDLSALNLARIKIALPGKSWTSIPSRLRPDCHKGAYRGFSNVYGRMEWGNISPTITGGCTTFSKGRFGHPVQDRTISVREAARLQTFPDSYIFDTPYMEHACNIIGNALPCAFAAAVAKHCGRYIQAQTKN